MLQYITNLTKRWIFAVLDVQLRRLKPTFINVVFYIYICCFLFLTMPKLRACNKRPVSYLVLLRRGPPSTICINIEPVGWYLIPSRAARVIIENSKIYSIFGAASLGPYGSQPAGAQTLLAPSSAHVVWKFQLASFKGSRNIKGGVKHTKIEKNRV